MCLIHTINNVKPLALYMMFKFFHTGHACRHHWPVPFYTTLSSLDIVQGSQDQWKAIPFGFVSSHTSQLIRMKSEVMLKLFKLNIRIVLQGEICFIHGKN